MKHVCNKLFWVWSYEKEEKWLNEMAAKGLNLTDVSFCRYVFEEGEPGQYQYRLEFLDNLPSHPESRQYVRFMEEMGVEHIASFQRWVYFRKRADEEPFDLFSDADSKIKHLSRIRTFLFILMCLQLLMGIQNIVLGAQKGFATNLIIGGLCLLLGCLFLRGVIWFSIKIKKLKKERNIHE